MGASLKDVLIQSALERPDSEHLMLIVNQATEDFLEMAPDYRGEVAGSLEQVPGPSAPGILGLTKPMVAAGPICSQMEP